MGYLKNHLATVTTAVFAAILTGLWPWFVNDLGATILNFVFIMAVPITWFLALMCWLTQKSTDYAQRHGATHSVPEKKNLDSSAQQLVYNSDGEQITPSELKEAKTELADELDSLRDTVKIQDTEIVRLKQDIANLETMVQIESLKTELANLKMLASKK